MLHVAMRLMGDFLRCCDFRSDWAIEGMARRVMSVKVDRRHRRRGVYSTSSACEADKGNNTPSPPPKKSIGH